MDQETLHRYHLATDLRWLLRHPYHDYPAGMPDAWRARLEHSGMVEWRYVRAGYWQAYATRDGAALLDWAAALEQEHPWLARSAVRV